MEFFKNIFKRYRDGEASAQEKQLVDKWYDVSGGFTKPSWITDHWIKREKRKAWQQLTGSLNFSPSRKSNTGKGLLIPIVWKAVAAILVLGACFTTWKWVSPIAADTSIYDDMQSYQAGVGVRKKFALPDGSNVWLNNGSSMHLSAGAFVNDDKREIWLDDGEAYFEVAKDENRPFVVYSNSIATEVLGTSFNINAYNKLAQTKVTVISGKVRLMHGNEILDTLSRNMSLVYDSVSGKHQVTKSGMPINNVAWWNGYFVLEGADFQELKLRMLLRYGVELKTGNPKIIKASFTATFQGQVPCSQVLDAICAIYQTTYKTYDDKLIIIQ